MTSKVKKINYSRYVLDKDLNISSVDDMFEEITGYTKADIKNLKINQSDLLPEEDRVEYFKEVYRQLGKAGEAYIEHRLVKKDGSIGYVYCLGTLEKDNTSIIRVVRIDDSLLRSEESKDFNRKITDLKNEAKTDNLTGLLRRDPYVNSVNYYLRKGTNLSFMIVDIDNFKSINDTYGHKFGDTVLIEISKIFTEVVGKAGYICRLGGDEFSITLLNIKNKKNTIKIVEKIIKRVQNLTLDYNGTEVKNTVSIGVYNLIKNKEKIRFNDLYTLSDKNLYISKEKGKNRYTSN